jgi:hypothetical protein
MVGCEFADYAFVLFRRRVGVESLHGLARDISYNGGLIA